MENKSQTRLDPATSGEPVNHARTKVTTNDEAPRWSDLYKAAMTESDASKMLEGVAAARAAMVRRQTELENNRLGTLEERWDLEEAISALDYWEKFSTKQHNLG